MSQRQDLQQLIQDKLGNYAFIVVSNRQPYQHVFRNGQLHFQRNLGGVVTALDPVMQACGGLWVAAGNTESDIRAPKGQSVIRVPQEQPSYTLKRIWLTKKEIEAYYYGYANDALWPLCHTAFERPIFRQQDWETYCAVNRKFAEAIVEEIGDRQAFVWIQDYHLCMLPLYLRQMRPGQLILAHFWHVPWPSYEAFRICPQKEEILAGLLANDLLGFHVNYHCNNFIDVVDRMIESKIDRERLSVIRGTHETLVRPFPISVDFEHIDQLAVNLQTENPDIDVLGETRLEGMKIFLGIDRIDFTKGIPERLVAFDRMLEKHPELKEKVVLLQMGAISRIHLPRYKHINDEINMLVEQVNWKHSTERWKPIVFLRRQFAFKELLALYLKADVCIVSSLHDGMNLVAKEFISSRHDGRGVLVLSQFTGAARELKEAVTVNPYDTDQFGEELYKALVMPVAEQERRMAKLRKVVEENNIFFWAKTFISELLKFEFQEQS